MNPAPLERPKTNAIGPLTTTQPPPLASHGDDAALFDYEQMFLFVGFVKRSAGRHPVLLSSVFTGMVLLTVMVAVLIPRSYHVQTKILAQRNQVMALLSNPHRAVPTESDAPTRAASETVLRRDNLVALIKQTNLIDQWDSTRRPIMKLKDKLASLFLGVATDEDKLDSLVGFLEKRLSVSTGEGTVTIALDWPHAQMAYQLVEAAQQNFLETRHVTEVSTIEEAISILEGHADNLHGSIERGLEEIQKIQEGRGASSTPASPKPAAAKPSRTALFSLAEPSSEQELTQIKFLLRAKRRAVQDLEEFRNKRLAELQAQMAEQKAVYSDQHPVILDTLQRIKALHEDSPQILQLKHDEEELLDEYRRRGGKDPDSLVEPRAYGASRGASSETAISASRGMLEESPQLAYAREQLRIATATYQDILLRVDAARIELDTARAAFKYRYSVINPAQLPKRAEKPNIPGVLLSGIFASLLFAVGATVLKDLRGGRVMEAWQLRKLTDLPLLAEVNRP